MYACARLTTLPFVLGVFAQRVVELAASARRLTTSARAARGGCHRLGLDREFPAGGLMRRGELAVGDGRIALVLKLDLKAGLRETADDEPRHASASARLGWCATVEKVVFYPRNARVGAYFHRYVMQLTLTCWRSPYCFDAGDMP